VLPFDLEDTAHHKTSLHTPCSIALVLQWAVKSANVDLPLTGQRSSMKPLFRFIKRQTRPHGPLAWYPVCGGL